MKTSAPSESEKAVQTKGIAANDLAATEPLFTDHRASIQSMKTTQAMMQQSPRATQLKRMQSIARSSMDNSHDSIEQTSTDEPLQAQTVEAKVEAAPAVEKPNNTGIPNQLKSGIEALSGISMDTVKVHYNSSQPAQLNALAYAQGNDIHLGPGQERHLPHEAWHVVQQAQGRVRPTLQMKTGIPVNDDIGLEQEADVMGEKAMQFTSDISAMSRATGINSPAAVAQRVPAKVPPNADGMKWDTFSSTDHNGAQVPEKIIGVMKSPDNGGTPSVDPPGWGWLKTKFGRLKGSWVRFHIINAELGGPGNDAENLVPTVTAVNLNGAWRRLEDDAKHSANVDDDWTYVEVDISYDDDYPAGIPADIDAEWGYHDGTQWAKVGNSVHLSQVNPDDDDNNNYLPAAQITLGWLQEKGLNRNQRAIMKQLIDATYNSQQAFENAVQTEEDQDETLCEGRWYTVLGKLYVDEDDDIPGPYGVVVRVS